MNSNLFDLAEKLEFLKVNEQNILTAFQGREIDLSAIKKP